MEQGFGASQNIPSSILEKKGQFAMDLSNVEERKVEEKKEEVGENDMTREMAIKRYNIGPGLVDFLKLINGRWYIVRGSSIQTAEDWDNQETKLNEKLPTDHMRGQK